MADKKRLLDIWIVYLKTVYRDMYWVGIDIKNPKGLVEKEADGKAIPWYSLGKDAQFLLNPTREPADVVQTLEKHLETAAGEVKLRIRADRTLPIEVIKGITLELQGLESKLNSRREPGSRVTFSIAGEVSEPQSK